MRVVAVAMGKGGTGKTTTCAHLAVGLSLKGRRVLVVDLDYQAQEREAFGVEFEAGLDPRRTLRQALQGEMSLGAVAYPVAPGVDLVPQDPTWQEASVYVATGPARILKLRSELRLLGERYDYAILDCPPALDALTVSALCAATDCVVAVSTKTAALSQLPPFLRLLDETRASANEGLQNIAVLPTIFEKTQSEDVQVLEILRQSSPVPVLDPIPKRIRIQETFARHATTFTYAPEASVAYGALVDRVEAPSFMAGGPEGAPSSPETVEVAGGEA